MRIIVFGSVNIDLTGRLQRLPRTGETLHGGALVTRLGGKGANQAVAAARQGADVLLVGRIGADAFGTLARTQLNALGVGTAGLVTDAEAATGVAMIQVDAAGDNTIAVFAGANARLGTADVARAAASLPGAAALLLQLEVPLAATLQAALAARAADVTVVLDPAPCPEGGVPDELLAAVDVVTPNEVEAEALTGIACDTIEGARRAAMQLIARGSSTAVVKLGARGAYMVGPGVDRHLPPFAVRAVDTVAAGDCFNAGLAVALAEGMTPMDALRRACASGALATTRSGAADAAPGRDEVLSLLADHA